VTTATTSAAKRIEGTRVFINVSPTNFKIRKLLSTNDYTARAATGLSQIVSHGATVLIPPSPIADV
jgi:hypothetical protein